MFVLDLTLAALLSLSALNPSGSMMIGEETGWSAALVGERNDLLSGLQLTARGSNTCQVRAFFRDATPRTAQYCRGRVTGRYVEASAVAVLERDEAVRGFSACRTSRGVLGRLRLHTWDGRVREAELAACDSDFVEVACEPGWGVQGVQVFFDGPDDGRVHRRLKGLRLLCAPAPGTQ